MFDTHIVFPARYFLLRVFVVIVGGLLLIVTDTTTDWLDRARGTLTTVLYPIRTITALPEETHDWLQTQFSERQALIVRGNNLEKENILLKSKINQYIALELENIRLRNLLDASYRIKQTKLLIGNITNAMHTPFTQTVTVDKGANHHVFIGQPVIDADGIFGQVVDVGLLDSSVILITDPAHAIPVQIKRNGLHVVATGDGTALHIPHLPGDADVQVGDTLVSSGLGNVYPDGYPVAEVIAVTSARGVPMKTATARPYAGLHTGREVLLVWSDSTSNNIFSDIAQAAERRAGVADDRNAKIIAGSGTAAHTTVDANE